MIPWEIVCHRCLRRRKAMGGIAGWCKECHTVVAAAMPAHCAQTGFSIGVPHYADYRDLQVVKTTKRKVRVRLVTGRADHLIPIEIEISRDRRTA